MKTIKVMPVYYKPSMLYSCVATKAMRDLAGYMVHTGRINDTTFGGALYLLTDLDLYGRDSVPIIQNKCQDLQTFRNIVAVAEAAKAGAFRKYTMSKRNMIRTAKQIQKDNLEEFIE